MAILLIKNAQAILLDRIEKNVSVLCEDGIIKKITSSSYYPAESDDVSVFDAAGCFLAPGFIDLHIHGSHKWLANDGPESISDLCRLLPRFGVTGWLPTLYPVPVHEEATLFSSLATRHYKGAHILGFHYEGPFLGIPGALPPEASGEGDSKRVQILRKSAQPYNVVFSVSPEYEDILNLVPIMSEGNVPVFMTHTAATVEQTQKLINAGVHHATHFYDVYPCPMEEDTGVRPCGVVEAVLANSLVSVDFILDGEHVDPVAVQMALACKEPDRVCLITDANIGADLPPGSYDFGCVEIEFTYPGGPARETKNSRQPGGLAGSGLTMDRAVRNALSMLRIDLPLAIRMVSANPAKVLGLETCKGQIAEGFDADLVLLDNNLKVEHCWIGGKTCYAYNGTTNID